MVGVNNIQPYDCSNLCIDIMRMHGASYQWRASYMFLDYMLRSRIMLSYGRLWPPEYVVVGTARRTWLLLLYYTAPPFTNLNKCVVSIAYRFHSLPFCRYAKQRLPLCDQLRSESIGPHGRNGTISFLFVVLRGTVVRADCLNV
jgi:hypothetical protein